MIIDGKGPYKDCKIYVITNYKQGFRKSACIYKNSKFIKCIGYAKYLVESENNIVIPDGYEVDHIDGDRTNDILINLQIISKEMNNLKQKYETGDFTRYVRLVCPYCGKQFEIEDRNYNIKLIYNKFITCSRSCAGKISVNKSRNYDISRTPFRPNYEYVLGVYYDLNEIKNIENILISNNVKFIKRY